MGIGTSQSQMTPGQLFQWYGTNINQLPFNNIQRSPINELLSKAQVAQANAPTMSQLFGGLGSGVLTGAQPLNYGNPSYGAGRFLGAGSVPLNTSLTTNTK